MNKKISTLLVDFWGVIVSESWNTFVNELSHIFSESNENITKALEKFRDDLRNWKINDDEFFKWIAKCLWWKTYTREDQDFLWTKLWNSWNTYNEDLVNVLLELKSEWYKIVLLSDSYPPLKTINIKMWYYEKFDDVILSCDIWISKTDDVKNWTTEIFEYALNKYWLKSNNVIFIDDRDKNCLIAEKRWIISILHTDNETTKKKLKKILK